MDVSKLENIINDAWENRDTISTDTKGCLLYTSPSPRD